MHVHVVNVHSRYVKQGLLIDLNTALVKYAYDLSRQCYHSCFALSTVHKLQEREREREREPVGNNRNEVNIKLT